MLWGRWNQGYRLIKRRNLLIHSFAHNYYNVDENKLLILRPKSAVILEYAFFHSFALRKQQQSTVTR